MTAPPSRAAGDALSPVLLIGGTRGTGLLIARLLMRRGVPIRVFARDPESAAKALPHPAEIVLGDVTIPSSLPAAVRGARHVIFTAGCRSAHPASERKIRLTEFGGVQSTLEAARASGFTGRFLYMTSSGVHHASFWTFALNAYKGNTLKWRAKAEALIRDSGLVYTIIRTGVLTNSPAGRHDILVTQRELPLSPRYRIARADVAAVFVAAMEHPRAASATFEIAWKAGSPPWTEELDRLSS
jgi:uncharacterized protein YbjT (DUF2867 family)